MLEEGRWADVAPRDPPSPDVHVGGISWVNSVSRVGVQEELVQ